MAVRRVVTVKDIDVWIEAGLSIFLRRLGALAGSSALSSVVGPSLLGRLVVVVLLPVVAHCVLTASPILEGLQQ